MNRLNKWRKWIAGIWRYNFASRYSTLLPREIIINLTYRCNSRCIMCNIWRVHPKNEMRYQDWIKVKDDLFFKKVERLTISGGEPMLHSEFNQIVKLWLHSLPKLKELSVITNGFQTELIVNRISQLAKDCQKAKIKLGVSVSMDGVEGKHEEVRKIKEADKKTKLTIKKLKGMEKKYKFSLGVGSVILHQNLGQIKKIDNFLNKMKIFHSFQLVGFHKNFVNNLETKDKVNFKDRDKKKLERLLQEWGKGGNEINYYWQDMIGMYYKEKPRVSPCPFLVDQAVIDGGGNVYYCLSERPIGNFLKEKRTMAAIYLDEKNIEFRHNLKIKSCPSCNSGCNVYETIKNDVVRYMYFKITGNLWYGSKNLSK